MYRKIVASRERLCRAIAGFAVLAAATIVPVYAQEGSSDSCRLLQVAELEAAIGGEASSPSGSIATVPGMVVDTCSVVLTGPGPNLVHSVRIHVVTGLTMEGDEALRVRNAGTASEPQWKAPGARIEQATVGSAICILAGRPDVTGHTTCSIPRGKGFIEVDVTGSVEALTPMETVGRLVEKARSRS